MDGERERDLDGEKISVKRKAKMPENKATVYRTSSYLSHSAYRKIKRVLSFRRREFLRPHRDPHREPHTGIHTETHTETHTSLLALLKDLKGKSAVVSSIFGLKS